MGLTERNVSDSTQPMVVREVLGTGLRLITEAMPHVRSVTIGVWLMRGSRHETDAQSGIAHFVEHMARSSPRFRMSRSSMMRRSITVRTPGPSIWTR